MSNREDLTRVEFLLRLEDNIIIQRFFNVKGMNKDAIFSIDLLDTVEEIRLEISNDLKLKTIDYLHENQNYFHDFDYVESETNIEEENFILEIKLENHIFMSRLFPAQVYHPKVRYTVDIRPQIRNFLSRLTNVLASDNLEMEYLGYNLLNTRG